jgi:lipoprotein-anchoring transpeptidase ErfK/SrfK
LRASVSLVVIAFGLSGSLGGAAAQFYPPPPGYSSYPPPPYYTPPPAYYTRAPLPPPDDNSQMHEPPGVSYGHAPYVYRDAKGGPYDPRYEQQADPGEGSYDSYPPANRPYFVPDEDQPEQGPPEELPPRLRRQIVDYVTKEPAGTIIIDTPNTYLYLVIGNGKALRYGIGVGREGFTWTGTERISRMGEWPDWHPPKEMIERQPYLPRFMAGGEGNPLGARVVVLSGSPSASASTRGPDRAVTRELHRGPNSVSARAAPKT